MDRFVMRTATWKTMNYGTVVAQSNNRSVNSKLTSSLPKKKQPLQQKQCEEITKTQDFFGERLADIFKPIPPATTENQNLNINSNSNDSGLSSTSSISPPQHMVDENVIAHMQTPTKNNVLGKLGDYVDCPEEKENDTYMTITNTPKSSKKKATDIKVAAASVGLKENTPSKQQLPQTPNKVNKLITTGQTTAEKLTTANPMLMSRIQRDLNSPSASVRVRALKAITSPTKSPYTHFDIPEAEQSLNFSAVQEAPDIKDVMRNVIVYVEVRSGEDNRSDGVRKVIEALGARVNLKLLRDTTHVVFKDGLLSTFKKAQQWGIPVVSILWIEACKTRNRICDPKEYPISNLDRYENPELYTKMKRFKNMQPDSESGIIRKVGGSAQREVTPTPKTGAIKKNSTLIGGTPTSTSNIKKKTDISQYFKKLDNSGKVMTTPISSAAWTTTAASSKNVVADSPATQLLNRISSNSYTPLTQLKKTTNAKAKNIECYDEESRESTVNDLPTKTQKVKKALDFLQNTNGTNSEDESKISSEQTPNSKTRRRSSISANDAATTPSRTSRRRSLLPTNAVAEPPMQDMHTTPSKSTRRRSVLPAAEIESTNTSTAAMTPSKNTRRRSSIHTPKNMTMETPSKGKQIQPTIIEEDVVPEELEKTNKTRGRRTLHGTKAMEISEQTADSHSGKNAIKENQPSTTTSSRRRTIYSHTSIGNSPVKNALDSPNVTIRRQTCYSVKPIEATCIQSGNSDKISSQKTLDVTNKMLNLLSKNDGHDQAKKTTSKATTTNRRRTLYTPKKASQNDLTTDSAAALGPQLSDGICITPTASNMHGKVVACSTLLESADKSAVKVKPIETPPATAITGKLLEETSHCAAPLVFSSTRVPGNRRRTLFDVSMDIITQRLQCINQSARRSLVPSTGDIPNADVNSFDTTVVDTRKSILPGSDAENSNSTPQSSNNVASDAESTADSGSTPILSKKRKLFIPNEVLTPPPILASSTASVAKLNTSSACKTQTATAASEQKKRRRTLMPLSQTLSTSTSDLVSEPSAMPMLKRRSTLDFEQIKKYQNKTAKSGQDNKAKTTEQIEDRSNSGSAVEAIKPKKTPVLVYTNMHKEQIDVIREVVDKLALFSLEQTVTGSSTHLVSLEPRRTMNLLRAIARGLWVVDYNWILDSQKAGEWLAEEPYELRDFSRAVEICRSERQAFGERYKCELFRDLGAFYISVRCYPVTKDDMCELITLCGGRLALSRNKARYIIGDTNTSLPDKIYVTPYWVLDSISQMQIMKIQKYICPKPDEPPAPISPIVVSQR